jgi:hypothetical protein
VTGDPKYWPTAKTQALLHEIPGRPRDNSAPTDFASASEPVAQGRWDHKPEGGQDQPAELCDLCAGTGWASYPDPFFDGALIDARCPVCRDTTVRATKSRWEDDNGHRVGPA